MPRIEARLRLVRQGPGSEEARAERMASETRETGITVGCMSRSSRRRRSSHSGCRPENACIDSEGKQYEYLWTEVDDSDGNLRVTVLDASFGACMQPRADHNRRAFHGLSLAQGAPAFASADCTSMTCTKR